MNYAPAARGAGLALLVAFAVARPVLATADDGAKIDIVELRQSDASLQATYAKGKRMMLPRVLLLDAQGRALAVEVGMSSGIDHRLSVALKNAKPLDTPITLDLVLTEVVDKAGRPVIAADLPKGDAYIVDYWAAWCAPCRMLARDIQTDCIDGRAMAGMSSGSRSSRIRRNCRTNTNAEFASAVANTLRQLLDANQEDDHAYQAQEV